MTSATASSTDHAPRFADYRDRHRGETIVVCGCGSSLARFEPRGRCLTIGVNDVGRRFDPDYLVVVNEARQFDPSRFVDITSTRAKAVFTQLASLPVERAPVVRFALGRRGATSRSDGEALHYSDNSPFVAVQLARHMGAARIGLVGVDFNDGHFFGATGRHPLAGRVADIDREYAALAASCRDDGVALVNLSRESRLASLPVVDADAWLERRTGPPPARIFFVHYRFLSCGTVFRDGLAEAADAFDVASEHADWDDADLATRIGRFAPDLLFVVHGRRFVARWPSLLERGPLRRWRSAVWLLDEPYEVDDTSSWSDRFDHVFVNDPATIARHRGAHALPVAHAPAQHHASDDGRVRRHRVGFIGGANPSRERLLASLAKDGLLDYVVGGPWREPVLGPICLAGNVPAERTADLYRDTRIVLNVFRDRHHYNRARIEATAMNPRIHEALACGALVLSEPRDELARLVPELPTFDDAASAATLVRRFLDDEGERVRVQRACAARLAHATYAERLRTVMDIVLAAPAVVPAAVAAPSADSLDEDWIDTGPVVRRAAHGELAIEAGAGRGSAIERGLASRRSHRSIDLSFDARLEPGACLVAKVRQGDQLDQSTNSYHVWIDEQRAYLARHDHVFRLFDSPKQAWTHWRLTCEDDVLSVHRDGRLACRVRDAMLVSGHAFVGVQGGTARLRRLCLKATGDGDAMTAAPPTRVRAAVPIVLRATTVPKPRLSIVTTVYDRVDCLRACIGSVRQLLFRDYEHLIVADGPPPAVIDRLRAVVDDADDARLALIDLPRRHDDWGIAPAAEGLRRARGDFVTFLSDDNGYTPDHADPLIRVLDDDPSLGFAYSSCRYDGRMVLAHPVPHIGRIDLGQPMFRRALFKTVFDDTLPFSEMAWDWRLLDTLMKRGVRWRHVDRASFIFRLARYPQLMPRSTAEA